MDDQNAPSPKSNEKKPPQHSNIVWYLLGFGILVLLFVTFWSGGSEEDIKWSDLLALVGATSSDLESEQYIYVQTGTDARPREIRLSDLDRVRIGTSEVTARVTRQLVRSRKTVD